LPGHHAVRCAIAHDYATFVTEEMTGRRSPPYPPLVRLANAVFSGLAEAPTAALAERGADWIRRLAAHTADGESITVIGPAPCPVERIKGRWRWHVLVKAEHAGALTRLGQYFVRRFPVPTAGGLRLAWDRDPVALL
jgi:primosomal protein N' (replication factor Y) (superfamily II helicase)